MKMKPAIAITTTILVSVLAAGLALAQSPSIIQNTRNTMNGVSSHATAASNQALGIQQSTPAAASAAHASVKSSGVGVVTPVRSSSDSSAAMAGVKPAGGKHRGGGRRIRAFAVTGSAPAEPAAEVLANNPPADSALAGNGVSGSGEGENGASEQPVVPDSKSSANVRRDPFISPVVSHAGGSGCSTGKKCLEIGAINLRGVVRSEGGFIAVVSNGLNKAYFLRDNDPVFNGYVVKITGDSIVFQETLQDRMGKTFTREVVKKITTPAV